MTPGVKGVIAAAKDEMLRTDKKGTHFYDSEDDTNSNIWYSVVDFEANVCLFQHTVCVFLYMHL